MAKRVMVFGVFDLLHPGHLYLLYRARLQGEELVAVVARDKAVRRLKGVPPEWSERRRLKTLKDSGVATKVVLGDARQGSYQSVKKYHPDLICLGYDQKTLKKDLETKMKSGKLPPIPLRTLKAYRGRKLHTSLLRKEPSLRKSEEGHAGKKVRQRSEDMAEAI